MAVKVTVKSDLSTKWLGKTEQEWKTAALRMATDIHRLAVEYAPVKDSHLRNSGKILPIENGYKVRFGGSDGSFLVPYARIHELGGWTGRNYATYIEPKRYLQRAGEQVTKDKAKYIKGKS